MAPEDREEYFTSFFRVCLQATPTRIVSIGKVRPAPVSRSNQPNEYKPRASSHPHPPQLIHSLHTPLPPPAPPPPQNTHTHTHTHTHQGFGRDGKVQLFLCEARPARINADGTPWGVATSVELCPPSRHVSEDGIVRARHSRVQAFRRPRPFVSATGEPILDADADAAAANTAATAGALSAAWLRELQKQESHPTGAAAEAGGAALPAAPGLAVVALPLPSAAAAALGAVAVGSPPSPLGGIPLFSAGDAARLPPPPSPLSLTPLSLHPAGHPLFMMPSPRGPQATPDLDLEFLDAVFEEEKEGRGGQGVVDRDWAYLPSG